MNTEAIAAKLKDRQNKFFGITVDRPVEVLKKFQHIAPKIRKVSLYQGILCDYARRAPVADAVESQHRDAPELPKHVAEVFHIQGVKLWRGHNGQEYFPMPVTGNKPKTHYVADGIETPYEDIEEYLPASEKRKKPTKEQVEAKDQAQFNAIKVENIVDVR